jgi:hypothetical protein
LSFNVAGILMKSKLVPKNIKRKNDNNCIKYRKDLKDPNMTCSEKAELARQWYEKTEDLLRGIPSFSKRELEWIVKDNDKRVQFRYICLYLCSC